MFSPSSILKELLRVCTAAVMIFAINAVANSNLNKWSSSNISTGDVITSEFLGNMKIHCSNIIGDSGHDSDFCNDEEGVVVSGGGNAGCGTETVGTSGNACQSTCDLSPVAHGEQSSCSSRSYRGGWGTMCSSKTFTYKCNNGLWESI